MSKQAAEWLERKRAILWLESRFDSAWNQAIKDSDLIIGRTPMIKSEYTILFRPTSGYIFSFKDDLSRWEMIEMTIPMIRPDPGVTWRYPEESYGMDRSFPAPLPSNLQM